MTATLQNIKPGDRVFLTPRVPQGLAAAVEGLTREVIRHRPENIYTFAAHHFENLLRLREQYDHDDQANKKNMKILHDMNEAIKERHVHAEPKQMNDYQQSSGWSLNETAKVLEKHRSIFGEMGQKISTDEVRELAKEPLWTPPNFQESSHRRRSDKSDISNKNVAGKYTTSSSSRKKESPRDSTRNNGNSKSDSRRAPKIISQIPLTKDIKTELKKNRISSKERKKIEEKKMQVACEYTRETTVEKTTKRSVEKTKRTYESRSESRKVSRSEDNTSCTRKKTEITKEKVDPPKMKRPSRSLNMDDVKNYTVQNIFGMASLEELQSPTYIRKVQQIIDETSCIIKDKVEALKAMAMEPNKRKTKRERSTSSDERSNFSTDSVDSDKKSQEGSLQEASFLRKLSKTAQLSKSTQSNLDNLIADDNEPSADQPESKVSLNSDSSNESKISLPAVRPPSSKSTSRSLSARSDADGLVLPPISPESTKSPKVKEELILPVLSPPRSTPETPDVSARSNGKTVQKDQINNDEEFQDSLNVTPDLLDTAQRPDSLETSEIVGDKSDSSGHVSPLETLKDKLMEIEQVQKRIETVLDDTTTKDDLAKKEKDEPEAPSRIKDKLAEIQESEKRIEKILDSQATSATGSETTNANIKSKLQELEAAEKRIENIFVNEASKETKNPADVEKNNLKQKDEKSPHNNTENTSEKNTKKEVEKTKNGNAKTTANGKESEKKIPVPAEPSGLVSPHSYILTEGSPHEIPDSVTTVIIPDRVLTPDSDTLRFEFENVEALSSIIPSTKINTLQVESSGALEKGKDIHDAFGEAVDAHNVETSTVDYGYIRGIKKNHDIIVPRQDLDLIQEEHDKEVDEAEVIDSEDEKVLKVVTSSLEEILEKDKVEYVSKEEVQGILNKKIKEETEDLSPVAAQSESTNETKETSITDGIVERTEAVSLDIGETTARSGESTSEVKETSLTTDRSSLSFDPAIPIVPELNLDSLPDLTISSFNLASTDDENKEEKDKKKSKGSSSSEISISPDGAKGDSGERLQSNKTSESSRENKEELKDVKMDHDVSELQSSTIVKNVQENKESIKEINVVDKDSELQTNQTIEKIQLESKESMKEINVVHKDSELQSNQSIETSKETKESIKEINVDHKDSELQSNETIEKSKEIKESVNDINDDQKKTEIQSSQTVETSQITLEKVAATPKEVSTDERKLVEEFQKEYVERVETEEYEKLEKILESTSSEERKTIDTTTTTSMIANENIEQDVKTSARDESLAGASAHVDTTNSIEGAAVVPDSSINNVVCDESESNKQITQTALPSENKALAHQANDAKSSSLPAAAASVADQSGQLPDSAPSQRTAETRRLDSDDPSIKINEASALAPPSRDAVGDGLTEKSDDRADVAAKGEKSESEPKTPHHVYMPETSMEPCSSSESSTIHSITAVTRIQAGVRGFLTRRRLQSTQLRSSTLDSVPSIQESFAADGPIPAESAPAEATSHLSTSHLMPSAEPAGGPSSARKKLRREDAVQRTTLSIENAFAESQLQHTGEFHDCIPLPVFDARALSLKAAHPSAVKQETSAAKPEGKSSPKPESKSSPIVENLLGKILLGSAAAAGFAAAAPPRPFVDVVLLPPSGENELQNRYLNFITSVEDVYSEPPGTPKTGVIIEEITSLDESKSNPLPSISESSSIPSDKVSSEEAKASSGKESPRVEKTEDKLVARASEDESAKLESLGTGSEIPEETLSLAEASMTTSDEPFSMNIDEVLGLGEEDESLRRAKGVKKLSATDLLRSGSGSQESSQPSGERTARSPVTMMQAVAKSADDKSDKSEEKRDTKGELAADTLTVKEDENSEEKERESPVGKKSNESNASPT